MFLNLAAANNDHESQSPHYFDEVNYLLPKELFASCKRYNPQAFVNLNSFHALDRSKTDRYSSSKRKLLDENFFGPGPSFCNLCVPIVYGESFTGRLSFLNQIPRRLRPTLFRFISPLAPVVNINKISEFVLNLEPGPLPSLAFVCDSKDEDSLYKILKRVTDLLFCVFVFVLLIVSYLPIALLVASESKGPIIFKQSRVGKNLANFSCWKFRTMTEDTKDAASHLINPNSVTKWGKFLRRFKVDELPQIKNIIVGEMSLVDLALVFPVSWNLLMKGKIKACSVYYLVSQV